jgi:hypothetical protein
MSSHTQNTGRPLVTGQRGAGLSSSLSCPARLFAAATTHEDTGGMASSGSSLRVTRFRVRVANDPDQIPTRRAIRGTSLLELAGASASALF